MDLAIIIVMDDTHKYDSRAPLPNLMHISTSADSSQQRLNSLLIVLLKHTKNLEICTLANV